MKIKEKDFVEIEYIGKIKDTNQIFDLTDKEEAKKHNIFDPKFKYGPRVICVGQKEIIPGIDNALINQEAPSKITINIKPEEAFGKRNEKIMKTITTDTLLKQNITPYPGLQISASGMIGMIRSVSRGRTIVDFNHPLAGKELTYDLKINSIVTDDKIKLINLFENAFHLSTSEYSIAFEPQKAQIKLNVSIPSPLKQAFEKKAKELINLEVKFV